MGQEPLFPPAGPPSPPPPQSPKPLDSPDQRLLANVHPGDWINPEPLARYHLVVLGGGTAGLVCAVGAAGLGAKVALVEAEFLGGDCLNAGCVPSKALVAAGRALAGARAASSLGVQGAEDARADFPAVMARLRAARARLSEHDSAQRLASLGVHVFLGQGRFSGPETLEVGGATLRFSRAVIATGSSPGGLPFRGLKETGYLTNKTVFNLNALPPRLAVLGTGPLGCELAQAFARLGSAVVMVGRSGQIMTREDPEAASLVAAALRQDGVDLRLNTGVDLVQARGEEKLLHLRAGDRVEAVAVDEILVGAGRDPNVNGLGLEAAGVEHDRRAGVKVDEHLRTTNPRIFAAGDVCLEHKFTHAADAAARVVIQNALFAPTARFKPQSIPWCTYTDPEVAHVGLYPDEAEQKGLAVQTIQVDFADLDRAVLDAQEAGLLKLHLQAGTDKILGATLVASHAGEMIGEIALALSAGLGLKALGQVIHPYPTQAEVFRKAADAFNRARLTPALKRWIGRWLAWRA
jgi:pyruvate/2-oxoglutarate dehydrogenase complex dihydrolipoamide dehydrogenase (E3) component